MKRILVPTDFSDTSRVAIQHALDVADAVSAELLLLHVIDEEAVASAQFLGIREVFTMTIDPTGHAFSYEAPREADYLNLCTEATWKLEALLPPLESDRLRTIVVVGKVADEIIRVAIEEQANLIMMGTQGKQGWRRIHLDSISEKVIQHSTIPVMTLWLPRNALSDRGRERAAAFAE